jgi:uroporphyrinogen-III synthase
MKENASNKTVLITRREENSGDGLNALTEAGYNLFFFPSIETVFCEPGNALNVSAKNFDYIVFPSANAVKFFLRFLKEGNIDFDFENVVVTATGSKTAEVCKANRINVEIIPESFSAEGLLEYFSSFDIRGKRFLIPSSKIAREELSEGLKRQGAEAVKLTIYDTVKAEPETKKLNKLKNRVPNIFVFTSPSSFKYFLTLAEIKDARKYFSDKKIFAIGKTTAEAIRNYELENVKYPEEFTLKGIAQMILKSTDIVINHTF